MNQPKITVLTPTYNDETYLPKMIDSLLNQSYQNWQHIIINDGSTDGTREFLDQIKDSRVKVIHQENADQLNALKAALPFIEGDFVCMMHSDDTFNDIRSLEINLNSLIEIADADGVVADFVTMNETSKKTGEIKTIDPQEVNLSSVLYTYGCNYSGDPFFVRRKIFEEFVVPNYIQNNTFYYFKPQSFLKLTRVQPWYRYRVFSENYIHSDIGKFVALMGQFRTICKIFAMKYQFKFIDPTYSYLLFRIFRKLNLDVPVKISNNENKTQLSRYFKLWVRELTRLSYPDLILKIAQNISFYNALEVHSMLPVLKLDKIPAKIYTPADGRSFFKDFQSGDIDPLYYHLVNQQYSKIQVSRDLVQALGMILNFFSYPESLIEVI